MTTIVKRLRLLTPTLSAKERAVLVLRALQEDHEPDPQLTLSDSPSERATFHAYMGLVFVANTVLGEVCYSLLFYSERLEAYGTVDLLREASAAVAEQLGEAVDERKVRAWRKRKRVTLPEYLLGLAEDERQALLEEVQARRADMSALELVWSKLAAEFNGADPLLPEARVRAREASEKLTALATGLGGSPPGTWAKRSCP